MLSTSTVKSQLGHYEARSALHAKSYLLEKQKKCPLLTISFGLSLLNDLIWIGGKVFQQCRRPSLQTVI